MEWSDEQVERLRYLWLLEGEAHLSTKQIGEAMGISKNAVVAKAGRIGLPGRGSPIKTKGENWVPPPRPDRRSVPKPERTTLPPLPSIEDPKQAPKPIIVAPPKREAPKPVGRIIECCYPLGTPGTRDFRYCDAPSLRGKSYCAEHADLCWIKRPKPEVAEEATL